MNITPTWQQILPTLLVLREQAVTAEGRQGALDELKRMAWLADNFGKPLEIVVFPMAGDVVASSEHPSPEVTHYDVMIRPEGSDPMEEHEDLTEIEAERVVEDLQARYPQATIDDLRELLT